jgi:hypothetical protein
MAGGARARRKGARKHYYRLSQEKKERFLEVLGQTGNRDYAAEAIGVEPRLMDQRREYDPVLDRQWEAALEQADRRLAGASGPLDAIGGAEPMVIRRGRGGRAMLVRAGAKRWSRPVEERFFAALASCGNIAASARAVGFSESCIVRRRRQFAPFEQRLQEALEDAELVIEFRAAAEAAGKVRRASRHSRGSGNPAGVCEGGEAGLDSRVRGNDGGGATGDAESAATEEEAPFDMDAAMRFLKWRQEKRRGGGRRGRVPAPPSIDEVTKKIIRKVEAIKRARERRGSGGCGA